ncbi:PepSY-like domain-containing protein [uncultured Parabacteroides sp.]|uniref:PepSY-like domain-containing protein n=1 Tax=uncultured Parabacteroides sp. TaxID=512312 RepID=UPI00259AEB36|nr:PepSY-like domain-containing protein [uncultured Parabacteroides sp.]
MNIRSIFLSLFAVLGLFLASCDNNDDDHKNAIEPTEPVMQAFNKKYPNASNPIFTIEGNYYVAEFTNNSVSTEAWLTEQGKWMMDKADTPFNQLPEAVTAAFDNGLYAGWKVDDSYTINRDSMTVVYKIDAEKGNSDMDLYYSLYGNLIKAVNDERNEDAPIVIPAEVHTLMAFTFATCDLLDIQSNADGYILNMLDGKVYKIAQLNKNYLWQSTSYQITEQDVPEIIMDSFQSTGYAGDTIESILVKIDANGTFYTFTVDHNGQSTEVTFDAIGNIVQ